MVTITRDGALIQMEELTQEQKDQAWLAAFSAFLRMHPEVLNTGGQDAAEPGTGSA